MKPAISLTACWTGGKAAPIVQAFHARFGPSCPAPSLRAPFSNSSTGILQRPSAVSPSNTSQNSGKKDGNLDIDGMLENNEALAQLRSHLFNQMQVAQRAGERLEAAKAAAADKSESVSGKEKKSGSVKAKVFREREAMQQEEADSEPTASENVENSAGLNRKARRAHLQSNNKQEAFAAARVGNDDDKQEMNVKFERRRKDKEQVRSRSFPPSEDRGRQPQTDYQQGRYSGEDGPRRSSNSYGGSRSERSRSERPRSERPRTERPRSERPRTERPNKLALLAKGQPGIARVVLKADKVPFFDRPDAAFSPMVYGGAVAEVDGRPAAGDVVLLTDDERVPLAWGVFNPVSLFQVRVMQTAAEVATWPAAALDMPALLSQRLQEAVMLRRRLALPRPGTDVYRLVNSEGDRLSGLMVDVMGTHMVVQSCAAWTERYKDAIMTHLQAATGLTSVRWRPAWDILKQDGLQPPGSDAEGGDEAGEGVGGSGAAAVGELVVVEEEGVKYYVSPMGQKTGFYADQRDSRSYIARMSHGKRVLDLCCYTGGFALAAAKAGAKHVTGVDSSGPAIALARDNAALNALPADSVEFVREDISHFMKAAAAAGQSWDVVVLDPPKLAPNKAALDRALTKYQRLNELALRCVAPEGGLLVTCSCSGAVSQQQLLPGAVVGASNMAGRQISLLRHAGAAPDHPIHPAYLEGTYLTNLTYSVL